MPPDPERVRIALRYHARTEHHHPSRFARSLGYLDWETQPDPFLLHVGARSILLDEVPVGAGRERSREAVLAGANGSGEAGAPAVVDRASVSQLFFDSLALSAWKRSGQARWALRVNPSSGNLHPTEGYLLAGPIAGLTSGPQLMHYAPREHALEIRRRLSPEAWAHLAAQLPEGTLLLGLTTIAWREAWKYGERAFRYCQHDVGHAIGSVAVAAATLGWSARMIEGVSEHALARLLAVDDERGPEVERPDVLLAIVPRAHEDGACQVSLDGPALAALTTPPPEGAPTPLSADHHPWPAIDEVAAATEDPGEPTPTPRADERARANDDAGGARHARPEPTFGAVATRAIVRRRRSAVAMDAATGLSREAFMRFAARLLPHHAPGVLGVLPWAPRVHPVFFVHRVEGLEPGSAGDLDFVALHDQNRAGARGRADDGADGRALLAVLDRAHDETSERSAADDLLVLAARGLARGVDGVGFEGDLLAVLHHRFKAENQPGPALHPLGRNRGEDAAADLGALIEGEAVERHIFGQHREDRIAFLTRVRGDCALHLDGKQGSGRNHEARARLGSGLTGGGRRRSAGIGGGTGLGGCGCGNLSGGVVRGGRALARGTAAERNEREGEDQT